MTQRWGLPHLIVNTYSQGRKAIGIAFKIRLLSLNNENELKRALTYGAQTVWIRDSFTTETQLQAVNSFLSKSY